MSIENLEGKWSLVLVKSLNRFKYVPVCCVCGYVAHVGDSMYRYIKNEGYGRFKVFYKCVKCYNGNSNVNNNDRKNMEKELLDIYVCVNCGWQQSKSSDKCPCCFGPLIHIVKVKKCLVV